MSKTIILKEYLKSTSLVTRQSVRDLFDMIQKSNDKVIILDFKDMEFASRSFFDELNEKQSKLLDKKVEFINLNPDLQKLSEFVTSSSKAKSHSYSSVASAEVITI